MEDKKLLTFLVFIAIVLSAASLYWTYSINKKVSPTPAAITGDNNQNNNQPTPTPNKPVVVSVANAPSEGSANAPVTIVEFSDFQCPYCGNFVSQTYPQLKSQYIDTGKVKLYFRDFPLPFHQFAQKAAEASQCALAQGKFWQMHDKLFANQTALTVDNLKQYAKDLGLDTAKFNTCLDSGATADQVKTDLNDGTTYGVQGTPSFFINGTLVVGAQPFSVFQQAIDQALATK